MKSILAALLLVFAATAQAQTGPAISGDYLEVRSGEVYTCGCLYSSEMVTAGREAILVWRVASGEFHGVSLAGIKVAAVVVGDSNLGAYAGPRRSVIYLDGITSPDQKEAVLSLWQHDYSSVLGEIITTHEAPISFERQDGITSVEVPGVVRLDVRKAQLPQDAHLGSFLWYSPFVALRNATLATALHYEYWGFDFQREWRDLAPAVSGYMGTFALAG